MMEQLIFNYTQGYYQTDDIAEAPDGSMIAPSSNVIYSKKGTTISAKAPTTVGAEANEGGSRAFVLDDNLIGFMGNNITTEKAIGNMLLGSNRDLWFVGNTVNDGIRVSNNFTSFKQIGGAKQIESIQVVLGGAVVAGTFDVTFEDTTIATETATITVTGGETDDEVAQLIVDGLRAKGAIVAKYWVYRDAEYVRAKRKTIASNDINADISIVANAVNVNAGNSVTTVAGEVLYATDLETTPKIAKYDSTTDAWGVPVQVGLAPQETALTIELVEAGDLGAGFTGKITGSISGRIARKRNGVVSIASGLSNVVTADGQSLYAYIPPYTEDDSDDEDRTWLLYFTYTGRGSQSSHFLLPIELPENRINGFEANGYTETVGENCRLTVVSQHLTDQTQRKIEVEFFNNDLLLINPFEDYFPLDTCKFLMPLGNVMCAIGTGTDETGFDVSYPNNREAYSPDWRDWFREVPIAVASQPEFGFFWVLGTYSTYQAVWTGATQQTAPVVLREVSNKYGCIGEGACVSVNGVLYFISKGNIPVRIDANGNVDDKFGDKVLDFFTTFASTDQVSFDEKTNTVYFTQNSTNRLIGFQIDNGVWTAPVDNNVSADISAMFPYDGSLHYCWYTGATFNTSRFNNSTAGSFNWNATSNFKVGQMGFNLKDIIEIRAVMRSAVIDTITFTGLRNFNTSNSDALVSETTTVSTSITFRKLIESIDYEAISIQVTGTKYGQIIHNVGIIVDNHAIERTK